jgi:sterol desaturase/sphingolipid hydroxylase (fatty acid hydroxylase superfamily)
VTLTSGRCDSANRLRSLRTELFSRSIWLHPSAILDYKTALLGKLIERFMLAPIMLSAVAIGQVVATSLGPNPSPIQLPSIWAEVLYTVATVLAADLSFYVGHRLAHRVPMLWEFHKVHHSAMVLTPVTYLREHPVDQLLLGTAAALFVGPVTGLFLYLFPADLTVVEVLGVNAITFVWYLLLGANLRHSHVWLPFGPVLDRLFSSPAQHQIHHSDNPAHYDKNFGSMLAIWDWIFGTLHAPLQRPAQLRFGLGAGENEHYQTIGDFYLRPFRKCMTRFVPALRIR